jgi:hypothetical protein
MKSLRSAPQTETPLVLISPLAESEGGDFQKMLSSGKGSFLPHSPAVGFQGRVAATK